MTTLIADFRLGVMISDSAVSDEDRVWSGRKVFRYRGALYGFAGDTDEAVEFMAWIKGGKHPKFTHSDCLVLSDAGLTHYNRSTVAQSVASGIEAIGSGAKAAICAYEALGFTDPVQAVKITCKHDSGSRTPVRIYRLKS
jgi:hypothetical protein